MEEKKKYPSLPSNYISIIDLQERWIKQKQQEDEKEKQKEQIGIVVKSNNGDREATRGKSVTDVDFLEVKKKNHRNRCDIRRRGIVAEEGEAGKRKTEVKFGDLRWIEKKCVEEVKGDVDNRRSRSYQNDFKRRIDATNRTSPEKVAVVEAEADGVNETGAVIRYGKKMESKMKKKSYTHSYRMKMKKIIIGDDNLLVPDTMEATPAALVKGQIDGECKAVQTSISNGEEILNNDAKYRHRTKKNKREKKAFVGDNQLVPETMPEKKSDWTPEKNINVLMNKTSKVHWEPKSTTQIEQKFVQLKVNSDNNGEIEDKPNNSKYNNKNGRSGYKPSSRRFAQSRLVWMKIE